MFVCIVPWRSTMKAGNDVPQASRHFISVVVYCLFPLQFAGRSFFSSDFPRESLGSMSNFSRRLALPLILAAFVAGCSTPGDQPPVGQVTGKVSIDGNPLSGVIISFMPDLGRAATAVTDEDGEYDLIYLDGVKGCKIGPNSVIFAVPTGGSPSHAIPKKYQSKSDLKADVKSGSNTFDFELKSDSAPATPPKKTGRVLD